MNAYDLFSRRLCYLIGCIDPVDLHCFITDTFHTCSCGQLFIQSAIQFNVCWQSNAILICILSRFNKHVCESTWYFLNFLSNPSLIWLFGTLTLIYLLWYRKHVMKQCRRSRDIVSKFPIEFSCSLSAVPLAHRLPSVDNVVYRHTYNAHQWWSSAIQLTSQTDIQPSSHPSS